MIINAYTLYDCKSLSYSPPFFAITDGVALRMLEELANDLQTSVGRHPQDFTLYRVGSFDDQSGQLLPHDVRHHVADAITLVRNRPAPDLFSRPAGASPNGSDPYSVSDQS